MYCGTLFAWWHASVIACLGLWLLIINGIWHMIWKAHRMVYGGARHGCVYYNLGHGGPAKLVKFLVVPCQACGTHICVYDVQVV